MVSACTTLSSARSMGAQAVSALQLLVTMQSLELTPAERLQFGDQCLREWGRNGKSPAGTSPEHVRAGMEALDLTLPRHDPRCKHIHPPNPCMRPVIRGTV